jgi:hypothetical protein
VVAVHVVGALPILITVALAAAVENPWLAFIPIALLVIAWVLRDRWSWPAGMRWPTLVIVVIVGLAFLIQQLPDDGDGDRETPEVPTGRVPVKAARAPIRLCVPGRHQPAAAHLFQHEGPAALLRFAREAEA